MASTHYVFDFHDPSLSFYLVNKGENDSIVLVKTKDNEQFVFDSTSSELLIKQLQLKTTDQTPQQTTRSPLAEITTAENSDFASISPNIPWFNSSFTPPATPNRVSRLTHISDASNSPAPNCESSTFAVSTTSNLTHIKSRTDISLESPMVAASNSPETNVPQLPKANAYQSPKESCISIASNYSSKSPKSSSTLRSPKSSSTSRSPKSSSTSRSPKASSTSKASRTLKSPKGNTSESPIAATASESPIPATSKSPKAAVSKSPKAATSKSPRATTSKCPKKVAGESPRVLEALESPIALDSFEYSEVTLRTSGVTISESKCAASTVRRASTLVFFDLETTGLAHFVGKSNVQITEISMIAMNRKEFEQTFNSQLKDVRVLHKLSMCVKPRAPISSDAARITGLNDTKLSMQNSFDWNVGSAIISFLNHLPKPVCVIAHNGDSYDFPLLKAELNRLSLSLPEDILICDSLKACKAIGVLVSPQEKTICSSVKINKDGRISNALENLHLHFFNKKPENSHNSEGDCMALAKVCHKMKDEILNWFDINSKKWDVVVPMW